jgi:hypothetical protein
MHAAHAQRLIGFGSVLWLVLAGSVPSLAESWRITVRGNGTDLGETPVVVALQQPIPAGDYAIEPGGKGIEGRAQVFTEGDKTYLALIATHVAADGNLTCTMRPVTSPEDTSASGVALRRDGANVKVLLDGELFTEYLGDSATKPYFYPVIGPTGAAITRHHPMKKVEGEDQDHNHQRSFWFTHGNVNGFDFWASDPLNPHKSSDGTIKETSKKTVAGAVLGVIRTTDDWLGPNGKRVCEDERVATFYDTESVRIVDFDIKIKASDGPVTFGDTKEGMFGLRVASSMDVTRKKAKGQGKITNAEGITDNAAWGKASPWVDYVGPVQGRTVGVAILNHPQSFRYPTTWHVRDYGLFAANPFGWHDFGMKERGDHTIPAGESISFRYRLVFHKGDTAEANIPAAFQAYVRPLAVEVQAE